MSGPHYDRFGADRGRDHDQWNGNRWSSGRDRGGYDDYLHDDWRRRR